MISLFFLFFLGLSIMTMSSSSSTWITSSSSREALMARRMSSLEKPSVLPATLRLGVVGGACSRREAASAAVTSLTAKPSVSKVSSPSFRGFFLPPRKGAVALLKPPVARGGGVALRLSAAALMRMGPSRTKPLLRRNGVAFWTWASKSSVLSSRGTKSLQSLTHLIIVQSFHKKLFSRVRIGWVRPPQKGQAPSLARSQLWQSRMVCWSWVAVARLKK
mmetsp:Transcript_28576/g.87483  ORF Transcript_28576/g.87483 Transcript_28576/m.87483 type:complete len:219 (-) Transcript_28576:400-1056(-)